MILIRRLMMKYFEGRNRITIEPTNDVEIAYFEEVFNLKKDGDTCIARRKNASQLSSMAYLEIISSKTFQPSTLFEHITDSAREVVSTFQSKAGDVAGSISKKIYAHIVKDYADTINTYEEDLLKRLGLAVKAKDWIAIATLAAILDDREVMNAKDAKDGKL